MSRVKHRRAHRKSNRKAWPIPVTITEWKMQYGLGVALTWPHWYLGSPPSSIEAPERTATYLAYDYADIERRLLSDYLTRQAEKLRSLFHEHPL